jgi:hypothetical protein
VETATTGSDPTPDESAGSTADPGGAGPDEAVADKSESAHEPTTPSRPAKRTTPKT